MDGAGTSGDPYIVVTLTDLDDIRNDVTAFYQLANDIDATPTATMDSGHGWDPIDGLQGGINGAGYTIDGLYVSRDESYVGFIGYTSASSEVSNITFTNARIIHSAATTDTVYVGVLCGYAASQSVWSECKVTGTINIQGAVSTNAAVGGAFGYIMRSNIQKCGTNITITENGTADYVGGFAGRIYGCSNRGSNGHQIDQCYSLGTITKSGGDGTLAAGFAGDIDWGAGDPQDSNISNCLSRANINAYASDDSNIGGFYTVIGGSSVASSPTTIEYSYAAGVVGGYGNQDAGFGQLNTNGTITGCFWDTENSGQASSDGASGETTTDMKNSNKFIGNGYDFTNIWAIFDHCNNGYPCLINIQESCNVSTGVYDVVSPFKDYTLAPQKVTLEAIRNLEIVYGGRFFIDKEGNAKYESRYHRNV